MMAVRYVVERFSAGQQTPGSVGDLSEVFDSMIDDTQTRVRARRRAESDECSGKRHVAHGQYCLQRFRAHGRIAG